MTEFDKRLTVYNGKIAARHLKEQIDVERYVEGQAMRVIVPVLDVRNTINQTGIDTQIAYGQRFTIYDRHAANELAWGQTEDGYVGYVSYNALGPDWDDSTYWVTEISSHLYPTADIKSATKTRIPFQSEAFGNIQNGFLRTATGDFIPEQHLSKRQSEINDYVSVAERFLGAPYLWGGTTSFGIDCSGLVQAAMRGVGAIVLRDSDMQRATIGHELGPDSDLKRGDLIFWDGHVGILQNKNTLIHANAFHMTVTSEPLKLAIERIGQKEFGQIIARRRPEAK